MLCIALSQFFFFSNCRKWGRLLAHQPRDQRNESMNGRGVVQALRAVRRALSAGGPGSAGSRVIPVLGAFSGLVAMDVKEQLEQHPAAYYVDEIADWPPWPVA